MIRDLIAAIEPLDTVAMAECQTRLDNLTKPLGSLHALEHLAVKIAGIIRQPRPRQLKKAILLVTPLEIGQEFIPEAIAGIFARHAEAALLPVMLGNHADEQLAPGNSQLNGVGAECLPGGLQAALGAGIRMAQEQIKAGVDVLGFGEYGSDSREAAQMIVAAYGEKQSLDAWGLLKQSGSRQLAAMLGIILAGAAGRAAVVLDGTVTLAAALLAVNVAPVCRDYLIGSHFSTETEQRQALLQVGIPAYLHLDLAAGGGVGGSLGMQLMKASLHVLNDMKTFGEAEVAVAQDGPGALKQRKDV